MKNNFINIAVIILIGVSIGVITFSANEDGVTATVTARNIALTVTDGSIAYGSLDLGTATSTLAAGLGDVQTVTNTGSVAEDFNIKGVATANWTLAAAAGDELYVHEFSTSTGSSWDALTVDYASLDADVASSATTSLDLQITVPTITTHFDEQSPNVTVQATLH